MVHSGVKHTGDISVQFGTTDIHISNVLPKITDLEYRITSNGYITFIDIYIFRSLIQRESADSLVIKWKCLLNQTNTNLQNILYYLHFKEEFDVTKHKLL